MIQGESIETFQIESLPAFRLYPQFRGVCLPRARPCGTYADEYQHAQSHSDHNAHSNRHRDGDDHASPNSHP